MVAASGGIASVEETCAAVCSSCLVFKISRYNFSLCYEKAEVALSGLAAFSPV